jgi:hypothetical protein
LAREHLFERVWLPPRSHVGLDEDGALRSAALIEALELDGVVYPPGSVLSFDAEGGVIGAALVTAEPVPLSSPTPISSRKGSGR